MKKIFTCIVFFININLISLDNKFNIDKYNDILYEPVTKNIISFTIYNFINNNKLNLERGYCGDFFEDRWKSPILNYGEIYNITFKKSNIFLDSNYEIYEYVFDKFSRTDLEKDSTFGKFFKQNKERFYDVPRSSHLNDIPNIVNYGLVGYYIGNSNRYYKILFISGYMFLDNIAEIIFKDSVSKENLERYVNIRFYNYFPENICLEEVNRTATFHSKLLDKYFKLKINYNGDYAYYYDLLEEIE